MLLIWLKVGDCVGLFVGRDEGLGETDGLPDGASDIVGLGDIVGIRVGSRVGEAVIRNGARVGGPRGAREGAIVLFVCAVQKETREKTNNTFNVFEIGDSCFRGLRLGRFVALLNANKLLPIHTREPLSNLRRSHSSLPSS